ACAAGSENRTRLPSETPPTIATTSANNKQRYKPKRSRSFDFLCTRGRTRVSCLSVSRGKLGLISDISEACEADAVIRTETLHLRGGETPHDSLEFVQRTTSRSEEHTSELQSRE